MQTHRQTDKQRHSSQYSVLYQETAQKRTDFRSMKKIKTKVNIRSILPKISFKMASVDQFKK